MRGSPLKSKKLHVFHKDLQSKYYCYQATTVFIDKTVAARLGVNCTLAFYSECLTKTSALTPLQSLPQETGRAPEHSFPQSLGYKTGIESDKNLIKAPSKVW